MTDKDHDNTRALLEQALEALESLFTMRVDEQRGKRCSDAIMELRAELAKPTESSYTAVQLAAMVLSDCGISTDCAMLHERVARRIALHEEQLIDNLQKLPKQATPAWHDAPTCAGWWVRNSHEGIGVYSISEPSIKFLKGSAARWYGPICEDAAIAKAEGRTE